jgi:hypothetical protein
MRLGKHGGLVFLCDDTGSRLVGVRDELHRKPQLSFQETIILEGASVYRTEDSGPSWAHHLLQDPARRGLYHHLADKLARIGPGFRFAIKGFEHTVSTLHQTPGRELHYFELDRPASALLMARFQLDAPQSYSVRCGRIRRDGDCFRLDDNTSIWISSPVAPSIATDAISFELPAGEKEMIYVIWSQPVSALLHPVAFALSRRESWVAAVVSSWITDRVPLLLPVDTAEEATKTNGLIREIAPAAYRDRHRR